ncbi:hypothetical protein QQZ08_004084 [Neonectria magnoliae]|uniref:NAD-dependent epimerase/dehydratase domain-containing protein n=1 Tax=Neonectria magnoliae TaxID=2732573 RepID=A0ABR1I7K4_9HYPO
MSTTTTNTALPKGATVFLTGCSGYMGFHVAELLLAAGYKVRGATRNEEKAQKTAKLLGNNPAFSTVIVPDFQQPGAFDEAVKDCDAVIHLASDTTMGVDPNKVIPSTVAGVLSILKSAAQAASVKRFTLTSSSTSVYLPVGEKTTVDADTFNEKALELAWAPPPYTEDRSFAVYAASKTEAEVALWKFVKEEKPGFVANTVLPSLCMGRISSTSGITGHLVRSVYQGKILPGFAPQYHVDVIDAARIHVIATVLDPNIESRRLFAFNVPFNWGDIVGVLKKLYPDAKTIADAPVGEPRDLTTVPNEEGAALLKKWYGQNGWKSLEQSIQENMEGFV